MKDFVEETSTYANKDKSVYIDFKPILDKSISILDKLNITSYDKSRYCIDFHQRNCFE